MYAYLIVHEVHGVYIADYRITKGAVWALQRTYVLVESAVLENEVEQLPHPYLSLSEFLLQHEKATKTKTITKTKTKTKTKTRTKTKMKTKAKTNEDEEEDEDENENENENENEEYSENEDEDQNENENEHENGRGDPAQEEVSESRTNEATAREEGNMTIPEMAGAFLRLRWQRGAPPVMFLETRDIF